MEFNFNSRRRSHTEDKSESVGTKIGATLFLLIFAGMGTFFMVMLGRAVFLKEAEWYLAFFLIIPGIFIYIGFGGIYATWFLKQDKSKVKSRSKAAGRNTYLVMGVIFLLVGGGVTYLLLIRPSILTWQARSWLETPCKIISASVGSHSDDDGTTYSIDITYEYDYEGQIYRSDRYGFIGGSSSGYEGKKAVVDSYKRSENPVCYVNPDNPSKAVLARKWTLKNMIGFFPLIFVFVGVFLLKEGLKRRFGKGPRWLPQVNTQNTGMVHDRHDFTDQSTSVRSDSVTIKPKHTPIVKFLGAIGICLFWNGIVSVFVNEAIQGFRHGQTDWFMTLFMIPFVGIGLFLIGVVIYQFMALFNPRYTLILQPGLLYPGTSGMLQWKCRGRAGRIQKLKITLYGTEEATYQVGTRTQTAKNKFYKMELLQSQSPQDIAVGQVGFVMPEETMHSFESDHNKIVWSIEIHGDIARWPDVKNEYKLTLNPKPIG